MAFPESFLQELAERNDIVDVVSSYVRLTKKSGSNLFGLCPFHSEKTPSFSVSPDKQIYHCFGCGKGGSVISFIMEIENLSFPEAVAFLANRAGMHLPEQSDDPGAKKRQRLLALNRDAARFFHAQLKTPAGQPARDYLARRQLTAQTVTRFGLGFAPDTWDSLVRAMKALGEFLRPEFINRVDEIICFNRLDEKNFVSIARIMLDELAASLKEKGFTFTYDDAVAAYLANKSYSLTYGARNLRRTIQKELEDVIATRIIDSYDHPVTQLRAVMKDGAIDLLSL